MLVSIIKHRIEHDFYKTLDIKYIAWYIINNTCYLTLRNDRECYAA